MANKYGKSKEFNSFEEYKDYVDRVATENNVSIETAIDAISKQGDVSIGGINIKDVNRDKLTKDTANMLLKDPREKEDNQKIIKGMEGYDDGTIRGIEGLEGYDDLNNKEAIKALGDAYMNLYLEKRGILKGQKNVNSKSRKAQLDKEKIDELNKKMGLIEDSQEFQDLVESIGRGEYDDDFLGNNLNERNILGAIASKVGTSKNTADEYTDVRSRSAKDNAKYDFQMAGKQYFDKDGGKIVSAANNILNSQIIDNEDPTGGLADEAFNNTEKKSNESVKRTRPDLKKKSSKSKKEKGKSFLDILR